MRSGPTCPPSLPTRWQVAQATLLPKNTARPRDASPPASRGSYSARRRGTAPIQRLAELRPQDLRLPPGGRGHVGDERLDLLGRRLPPAAQRVAQVADQFRRDRLAAVGRLGKGRQHAPGDTSASPRMAARTRFACASSSAARPSSDAAASRSDGADLLPSCERTRSNADGSSFGRRPMTVRRASVRTAAGRLASAATAARRSSTCAAGGPRRCGPPARGRRGRGRRSAGPTPASSFRRLPQPAICERFEEGQLCRTLESFAHQLLHGRVRFEREHQPLGTLLLLGGFRGGDGIAHHLRRPRRPLRVLFHAAAAPSAAAPRRPRPAARTPPRASAPPFARGGWSSSSRAAVWTRGLGLDSAAASAGASARRWIAWTIACSSIRSGTGMAASACHKRRQRFGAAAVGSASAAA